MKVFKKVKNRLKQLDGSYKLSSFWTSSETVEFNNGDTLEEYKASTDTAIANKGDGLYYDDENNMLYLLSGQTQISGTEIINSGTGEILGDVSHVTVVPNDTSIEISWQDPPDGENIEWGGTIVIRKPYSRPVDCLDGTVIVESTIRDQYSNQPYVDEGLSKNTNYYYRFFPYTTDGKIRTGLAVSVNTLKDDTIIEEFPSVIGTYTYNGEAQTVQLENFDSEKTTIVANGTKTNAGNYMVEIAPKPGYKWNDNSTDSIFLNWSINRAKISSTPVQSGTITYNGSSRTPTWSGYDSSKMTISGQTSATDAGTYIAVFTPTDNYCWNNSSIEGIEVSWVINPSVIDNIPTPVGDVSYTGTVVSPTWNYYDSNKLQIGGETEGTNIGNYIATFTPKNNYCWYDGSTTEKEASWSIVAEKIETIPTQKNTITYSGSSQTVTWDNYDDSKLTLSGTTSAINAGTYTATFTPKTGYAWSDGTTTAKSVNWTINRQIISTVPSQSGTLTYNGSSKSPLWNNYDTNKMVIGGETSKVNAGTYSATFTPTDNYCWSGGSTSAKTVSWTINRANGSVTLSKTSVSVSYSSKTATVTVSNPTGTVTVSSGNTSIATASYSSNTITITGVATGSTTITVNIAQSTNYYATSKSISVSASMGQVISAVPSQSNTLTYNGNSQSPTWYDYSSTQLTLSGTTSGTDAGTYTAIFTPKTGYVWSDGSTSSKNVNWQIEKVDISINKNSIRVTVGETNKEVILTNFAYYYDSEEDYYIPEVVTTVSDNEVTKIICDYQNTTTESSILAVKANGAAGTCVITIRSKGDINHNTNSVTITVTVAEGTPTLTTVAPLLYSFRNFENNNERGTAVVYNNEIHILGGRNNPNNTKYSNEHYVYRNGTWVKLLDIPTSYSNASRVRAVEYDGELYIAYGAYFIAWNGTSYRLITNNLPEVMNPQNAGGMTGSMIVYNNEIHVVAQTGTEKSHYKWNGSEFIFVATTLQYFGGNGIAVHNNYLYTASGNWSNRQLTRFENGEWVLVGTVPQPFTINPMRSYNGKLYLFGCMFNNAQKLYIYNESTGTWVAQTNSLPEQIVDAVILNNKLYAFGSNNMYEMSMSS